MLVVHIVTVGVCVVAAWLLGGLFTPLYSLPTWLARRMGLR